MRAVALVAGCMAVLLAAGNGMAAQPPVQHQVAPPDIPVEPANVQATLKHAPSLGMAFGPLRVRFEETTLEDVRRQLGVGTVAHRGDAGDSLAWLCYTIPDNKQPVRLWLTSGELQGNKYIGGVTAEIGAAGTKPVEQCPALPVRFRQVALDQSLWVGLPDAKVHETLGQPSHATQGWRMFDYSKSINHDQCEQQNWLWTKSRAGRVILIDAGQSSSC